MNPEADVRDVQFCAVCTELLETVIDLPQLPLTGIYAASFDSAYPRFDQSFKLCPACGHGQLGKIINPKILYNNAYGFRTSESGTASQGVHYFEDYLRKLISGKKFSTILEFGSNDGFLLHKIRDLGTKLIGVDHVADETSSSENVVLVRGSIEGTDFQRYSQGPVDLVVSEHTMEHIEDPKSMLEMLIGKVSEDCLFVLEFPCLDPLLEKYRFDQIFHQHTQYFSLNSVIALIEQLGCTLIDYTFNYNYWGAIIVAFSKSKTNAARNVNPAPFLKKEAIIPRYEIFRDQMEATRSVTESFKYPIYGYGAALMLPILGYHMNTDFSFLAGLLDDDIRKHRKTYVNLPITIQSPLEVDFSEAGILLTAMDNRRPILKKLIDKSPKIILNPLGIL